MHIAHFCGALRGGPLSIISEWTYHQVRAGHRVTLLYSPVRDSLDEICAALSPKIELVPIKTRRDIHITSDVKAILQLSRLLREMRPDILHLHSSKAGGVGRIAARIANIPTVYSPHAIAFLRTDVGRLTRALFFSMEWLLGGVGDATVACSVSELDAMRLIPGNKVAIPNGIDLTAISSTADAPSHEDCLDIVLCGRITAQKNPRLACEIAKQCPPQWRWTWLGDGELREIVEETGRIAISGWLPRSEILNRLGKSHVMVHTSSWEGMPLAILEAMAQGVPVIATDIVGNRDLIVPGVTGFMAKTPADFVQALERLAASPKLRQRLGEAAKARAELEFDQAKLTIKWLALYQSVLSARRSSTAASRC